MKKNKIGIILLVVLAGIIETIVVFKYTDREMLDISCISVPVIIGGVVTWPSIGPTDGKETFTDYVQAGKEVLPRPSDQYFKLLGLDLPSPPTGRTEVSAYLMLWQDGETGRELFARLAKKEDLKDNPDELSFTQTQVLDTNPAWITGCADLIMLYKQNGKYLIGVYDRYNQGNLIMIHDFSWVSQHLSRVLIIVPSISVEKI